MEIDHSAAEAFRQCPYMYYEKYLAEGTGLELKSQPGEKIHPLDFGGRVHELLEEYYNELRGTPIKPYPESPREDLELEAQMMMAAYRAKYPAEDWDEIVSIEHTFKIELPTYVAGYAAFGRHIGTGKMDVVFRKDGVLNVLDHKTQNRRSSSNHVKKWAARDQASFYLWVASKFYGEEIGNFYVNVLIRPSEKLQEGPIFPERQKLERTKDQLEIAVRDLVVCADDIERYKGIFKDGVWPSSKEMCTEGTWGDCDFYLPHTYGWDPLIREQKYQPKTPYLKLGDVPIFQP
jgi:PD-(D/E)XK nuclease superfamily